MNTMLRNFFASKLFILSRLSLGKQYKSEPVFYGWISVIPSLKYSQIREDLLCFVPWYTENLPRKKSPTQKAKIFIGFSVVESAGRLTPFKLETPESLEKNGFWASSDLYCFPKNFVTSAYRQHKMY